MSLGSGSEAVDQKAMNWFRRWATAACQHRIATSHKIHHDSSRATCPLQMFKGAFDFEQASLLRLRQPLLLVQPCVTKAAMWGLPNIRGTILGIPIVRTIVYWGLYWGPLILGNYPCVGTDYWKAGDDIFLPEKIHPLGLYWG